MIIKLFEKVGSFAENKDEARNIRLNIIIPAIEQGEEIILDFENIEAATQSFVHALISDLLRKYGSDILDEVLFKNCNMTVQKIIGIVVEYMQQAEE